MKNTIGSLFIHPRNGKTVGVTSDYELIRSILDDPLKNDVIILAAGYCGDNMIYMYEYL